MHLKTNLEKHSKELKKVRAQTKNGNGLAKELLKEAERENVLIRALVIHLALKVMSDITKREDLLAAVDAAFAIEPSFRFLTEKMMLQVDKKLKVINDALLLEINRINRNLDPESLKDKILNSLKNNNSKDNPANNEKQAISKLIAAKKKTENLQLKLKKQIDKRNGKVSTPGAVNNSVKNITRAVGFAFDSLGMLKSLSFMKNSKNGQHIILQSI